MLSAALVAKENGNIAFEKKDYQLACTYYGEAMQMDTTDYRYPLNRSMANLKLQRWPEAEQDASTALQLVPGNLKAYHRRTTARIEQGDFVGARQGEPL
jgi:tetratricopeptide (TPR) repeat protein